MRTARVMRGSIAPVTAGRLNGRRILLLLSGAAAFGWVLVQQPLIALACVAALPGVLLIVSPRVRVVLMAFGPIVFLGGSADFTPPKQLFLFAAAAAFIGSFLRSRRLRDTLEYRTLKPLFVASTTFLLLGALSFVVARLGGVALKPWLRDVSPYVLFAAAPYFALDGATTFVAHRLRLLLCASGLLGAFAFAVTWLNNRDITHLPISWIGFPTVLLPAALASYATAAALQGRRYTVAWVILAATCFSLLAATGTRSSLVLLASPVAIVFAAPHNLFRRALRLSLGLPLAAAAVIGIVFSVVALSNANTTVLRDRLDTFNSSASQVDRSYLDRLSQSRASLDAFYAAPVFGTGPGVPIEWRNSFGKLKSSSTVDSSFSYLTKFGVAGLLSLLVVVLTYAAFLARLARAPSVLTAHLALVGFGTVVVAWSILNVPFEDKGFPVGFTLLAAIATVELREALGDQSSPGSAVPPG
jgi:O-antigen ligase